MSWPTPQDFVEAIQNPKYAFDDVELAGGAPEVTPLGLPKVISGQFACVFKVASSGRVWAVRCFVRDFQDNKQRYDALSKALSAAALDFTVPFHFLEKGMRIRGNWYPIIKMEWLQGRLLGDYISDNSNAPAVLENIAKQIAIIHSSLKRHKIAHGDLQHGNAIVRNGNVILIDYDGMFVPGLNGMTSHEIGHRNYQHPRRRPEHFDETLDVFSVWVIYASLRILSIDPSLWRRLQCGDDSIIFKAADFKAPYSSKAFDELKKHQDQRIQHFAYLLERLCYTELVDVPDFSETVVEPREVPQAKSHPIASPILSNGSSWISDWTTKGDAPDAASGQSAWITDHLPTENQEFSGDRNGMVRFMFWGTLASPSVYILLLQLPISQLPVLVFIHAIVAIAFCWGLISRYRNDAIVIEKSQLIQSKTPLSGALKEQNKKIAACGNDIKSCEEGRLSASSKTNSEIRKIDEALTKEAKAIKDKGDQTVNSLRAKKGNFDSAESSEIATVSTKFLSQINALERLITGSSAQMNSELSSELARSQTAFIENFLKGFLLSNADIHGIGEKLTARLAHSGIRTAAEATFSRVIGIEGIGTQKGHAISGWRDGLVQRARSRQPSSLPADADNRIRSKYKNQIDTNTAKVASLKSQQTSEIAAIRGNYDQKRREIDREIGVIQASIKTSLEKAMHEGEKQKQVALSRQLTSNLDYEKQIAEAQKRLNDEQRKTACLHYQLSKLDKKLSGLKKIKPYNWLKFHVSFW